MLQKTDLEFVSEKSGISLNQVRSVIELLDQEMTVPFISRYRKEKTANLDEVGVQAVQENYIYVNELNERKTTIKKTIEQQEKLTPELAARIDAVYSKAELEDLYLPYKPKRRTRATIAREKGLEPLAQSLQDPQVQDEPGILAASYVSEEKGVDSVKEALKGASDILAESFSENSELRGRIRQHVAQKGVLAVAVTKEFAEKRTKFEQYYDYRENAGTMPSHRILAIRRGENEKVLRSHIEVDPQQVTDLFSHICVPEVHVRRDFLLAAFEDAQKRLILPSIETDIQMELKRRADEEAIQVFAANLENLLLAAPAGSVCTMGVDPGFRTGCKIVVLNETGTLKENATIYPTAPRNDTAGAKRKVTELIDRHNVKYVVIGNGTASRETRDFFISVKPEGVTVSVISEAGASVYSASEAGREEFPDHDVTVRGAVSIGRRFQDPLAELVKIDPKAIGVGQYQHDVSQSLLKQKLDSVVVSAVNRVGVELNTASCHLLKYVSGIGTTLARNIVRFREENGSFSGRSDLLKVRMFGAKAFEQSSGFLRIRSGREPLDATSIHPEAYDLVRGMCDSVKLSVDQVIGCRNKLKDVKLENFVTQDFGMPTLNDIVRELETPGRDPRKNFELFDFAEGIDSIDDLQKGMDLNGVITNVTRFGAFVDIGVHQDGLVHVSELSHRFVSRPEQEVSVGQKVRVRVIDIDLTLKRIQLSIKALQERPDPGPGKKKKRRKTVAQGDRKTRRQKPKEDPLESLKKKWGAL